MVFVAHYVATTGTAAVFWFIFNLVDEAERLEDAEDTDEAERTQQNHVACIGQEVREIRWQDRQ